MLIVHYQYYYNHNIKKKLRGKRNQTKVERFLQSKEHCKIQNITLLQPNNNNDLNDSVTPSKDLPLEKNIYSNLIK